MSLWTPEKITTALWLDAADSSTLFDAVSGGSTPADSATVRRWEDKSGNSRHATGLAGPTRRTSIQNGKDVCRFIRSSSQSLDATATAAAIMQNKPYGAIYAVQKRGAVGGDDQTILSISRNGNPSQVRLGLQVTVGAGIERFRAGARRLDSDAFTGADTANNSLFTLLEARANYAAGSISLRVNASQVATASLPSPGNTSSTASDAVEVGKIGPNYLSADVGEIIVLAMSVSSDENELIEGYLAWKWGIQGNLPNDHPYKNSAPKIGGRPLINGGLINHSLIGRSLIR